MAPVGGSSGDDQRASEPDFLMRYLHETGTVEQ